MATMYVTSLLISVDAQSCKPTNKQIDAESITIQLHTSHTASW